MRHLFLLAILLSLSLIVQSTPKPKSDIYNIRDYGAVGDSITFDTKAIQKTIDDCSENGGGIVWVPAGNYIIGTIKLKSNVTLSLDYGATLLGSEDIADYDTDITKAREGNVECLFFAENATNITIEGLGVIDGRGTRENFPKWDDSKPKKRLLGPGGGHCMWVRPANAKTNTSEMNNLLKTSIL
jgi:polygalacturonase